MGLNGFHLIMNGPNPGKEKYLHNLAHIILTSAGVLYNERLSRLYKESMAFERFLIHDPSFELDTGSKPSLHEFSRNVFNFAF